MKRPGIIAGLSAFASNLCAVLAAQPLSEDQAGTVIAPRYGLFNIARRCQGRSGTGPDGGLRVVFRLSGRTNVRVVRSPSKWFPTSPIAFPICSSALGKSSSPAIG